MPKLHWLTTVIRGVKVKMGMNATQLMTYAEDINRSEKEGHCFGVTYDKLIFVEYNNNERPQHICQWVSDTSEISCIEEIDHKLSLAVPLEGIIINVRYCPNCGFHTKNLLAFNTYGKKTEAPDDLPY